MFLSISNFFSPFNTARDFGSFWSLVEMFGALFEDLTGLAQQFLSAGHYA